MHNEYLRPASIEYSKMDTAKINELIDNYINTKIPGHVMNGCWSPSPKISTGSGPENEGMFFGFWAGEILRGLGLYLQVQNNIR